MSRTRRRASAGAATGAAPARKRDRRAAPQPRAARSGVGRAATTGGSAEAGGARRPTAPSGEGGPGSDAARIRGASARDRPVSPCRPRRSCSRSEPRCCTRSGISCSPELDGSGSVAGAVMVVTAPLVFAPVAAATWDVQCGGRALPGGVVLLRARLFRPARRRAYAGSELSLVYPIARGLAPVIVLVVTALALPCRPSWLEALGVVAVGAGVLLVRGFGRRRDPRGVLLGCAIAACIAGYTIIDKLRHPPRRTRSRTSRSSTIFLALTYVQRVAYRRGLPALRAELRRGADRGRDRRLRGLRAGSRGARARAGSRRGRRA